MPLIQSSNIIKITTMPDVKDHQFIEKANTYSFAILAINGETAKLKSKYKRLYVIAKVLGSNRYVVKDIPGFKPESETTGFYIVIESD